MKKKTANVLFASAIPERMDRDVTLPARFLRMLDKLPIRQRVKGKSVAVKMHVGGGPPPPYPEGLTGCALI